MDQNGPQYSEGEGLPRHDLRRSLCVLCVWTAVRRNKRVPVRTRPVTDSRVMRFLLVPSQGSSRTTPHRVADLSRKFHTLLTQSDSLMHGLVHSSTSLGTRRTEQPINASVRPDA